MPNSISLQLQCPSHLKGPNQYLYQHYIELRKSYFSLPLNTMFSMVLSLVTHCLIITYYCYNNCILGFLFTGCLRPYGKE